MKAAIACVELCREIGNSTALRPYSKREVVPGKVKGIELESFIRDAASTVFHQTCTAKMGRDAMSIVDGNLKVYGIENLRITDGSVTSRVTTGNKMAPCVIIGERAGELLKAKQVSVSLGVEWQMGGTEPSLLPSAIRSPSLLGCNL
jgi:choline dehydrogenase